MELCFIHCRIATKYCTDESTFLNYVINKYELPYNDNFCNTGTTPILSIQGITG